jgi:hypothetical protein
MPAKFKTPQKGKRDDADNATNVVEELFPALP